MRVPLIFAGRAAWATVSSCGPMGAGVGTRFGRPSVSRMMTGRFSGLRFGPSSGSWPREERQVQAGALDRHGGQLVQGAERGLAVVGEVELDPGGVVEADDGHLVVAVELVGREVEQVDEAAWRPRWRPRSWACRRRRRGAASRSSGRARGPRRSGRRRGCTSRRGRPSADRSCTRAASAWSVVVRVALGVDRRCGGRRFPGCAGRGRRDGRRRRWLDVADDLDVAQAVGLALRPRGGSGCT